MARFTIPRNLYFGQGTIEGLKNVKDNKTVIVIGDNSIKLTKK